MEKFITSKKQNLAENLSEGFINEQEIHQKELEDNEMLAELECKNLISNFASQKARKINFN